MKLVNSLRWMYASLVRACARDRMEYGNQHECRTSTVRRSEHETAVQNRQRHNCSKLLVCTKRVVHLAPAALVLTCPQVVVTCPQVVMTCPQCCMHTCAEVLLYDNPQRHSSQGCCVVLLHACR